jgi:hypothetical protein
VPTEHAYEENGCFDGHLWNRFVHTGQHPIFKRC